MVISWFVFIIVALIGNISIERDIIDTRRSYWSFILQKSACKLIYQFIILLMHLHTFTEHTHKPATSIPQKKAAISNTSAAMVATMIATMVQYDPLG